MSTFRGINPGDFVEFTDAHGNVRTGRAQLLLCFHSHVVVNTGGPHGRPQVVNGSNYLTHSRGTRWARAGGVR